MVKDLLFTYLKIALGLVIFSTAFTCFMLPYQLVTGGVSGISAFIYYMTGFHASVTYFIINGLLMLLGLYTLGWRFCLRTLIATIATSFLIEFMQGLLTTIGPDGQEHLTRIIGDQRFMAAVIGGMLEGVGLAIVFLAGGSTGGTDIIVLSVNKYRNMSLGRIMLCIDVFIVSLSWFIYHDIETLVTCYIALFLSINAVDYVVNSAHQSVQFTIISEKYAEIAQAVCDKVDRGVTILHGEGWYSKEHRNVLLIMARKPESRIIFQLIRLIDPKAFVTMSNVEGVFGEGFDKIKKG
ncbi:MAG: YitT family protein [Bacteroidaceae bacterium]|nr:YitT family protein [Bacteroidaceae bacterium]MBR1790065.1 YitT family protein [Bacteroidaceae bacterium]